jgi:hypothetical protein
MKVKKDNEDELYRIDVIGDRILVQAPYEYPYMWSLERTYNYVAVPIDTELGKKILSEHNYKVKYNDDVNASESIFRATQDAA